MAGTFQKTLQANRVEIVNKLHINEDLWSHLLQRGVFTDEERAEIEVTVLYILINFN